MFTGWTVREFMVYVFCPVVVVAGFILLVSWLSPRGVTGETIRDAAMWGICLGATGVGSRYVHRRRAAGGDVAALAVLRAVPVWVWVLFSAGHGVFVGALLALPLQFDFTLMMVGGAAVAAPFGLVLHRSARWPGRAESWLATLRALPLWTWVLFSAGYGVLAGGVLAVPLRFDFALMMAGGAVIGAPFGLVFHRSAQWRAEEERGGVGNRQDSAPDRSGC